MRFSTIRSKLTRNEASLCVTLHLADPSVFELTSLFGFDAILIDLEHHGLSVETAGQLMRAARVGPTDIIARPGKGEFMRMGRLLELGAQAILYPRCDSPAEAAEVVRWAKFAPLGQRGFDGASPDSAYSFMPMRDYIEHANRETLVIIQIEDQRSLDQVEAIATTPGVDLIMLGAADYSILSGFAGDFDHPSVMQAVERIARAAHKAGKHWVRSVGTPEQAQQSLEMGCRLLLHNADILMIKNGLLQIQQNFSPLGFQFDNRLAKDARIAFGRR